MNIMFDEKKSLDDWGLKLIDIKISFPAIKEKKVDIPGCDGVLDLSSYLTGDVQYENRSLQYTFDASDNMETWASMISHIANFLHGRKRKIVHDFDRAYYYEGRISIDTTKSNQYLSQLVITGEADPYKYDVNDGTDEWLWDDFDLTDGIIREYYNILIEGTGTVTIIGRRKRAIPIITCSAPMVLTYGNLTINLPEGETKVYELQLGEGEHELIFTGNGTVTISYRGGSL